MPKRPPDFARLLRSTKPERVVQLISSGIGSVPRDEYLHWDRMRYTPAPDGFTDEEWWVATKFARRSVQHPLPFKDKQGTPFWFSEHANMYRQLHEIDQNAGGHIEVPAVDMANKGTRDRYLMRSLVEEAITSSQLEGAATTRLVAKELVRPGLVRDRLRGGLRRERHVPRLGRGWRPPGRFARRVQDRQHRRR